MLNSAEFLNCESLPLGSRIDVETKSRHYHIECLGGNTIRISDPEYCPAPVLAHLKGSFDKENGLEWAVSAALILLSMRFPALAQDAEKGKEYQITIESEEDNQYTGPYG